ncbi:MAG: hypothetical protein ACYC36_02385 [Bellilinea sp.]
MHANELGSNLGTVEDDDIAELRRQLAERDAHIEALTRENNTPLSAIPEAGVRPLFARVNIILEENEGISPSGQYFGLHGSWVNPEELERLEPQVQAGEMTRAEALVIATEKVQFEAVLRPGEEASVPVELLSVLNDALTDSPVIDPITSQVLGYKQKLRYPYRIVTSTKRLGH